jgi:hypothetical protein
MYTSNGSTSRFSWLLSPTLLPPPKSCLMHELEEACLFLKQCWRVSPEILPKLTEWAGNVAESSTSLELLKSDIVAFKKYSQIQNSFLARIASQLDKNDVPYSFLKSSALRFITYDDPANRVSSDIDIAIPSSFLECCKSIIVRELDFEPAQWNGHRKQYERANIFVRKVVEASHYELGYFVYRYHLSMSELTPVIKCAILNQIERYPELWFMDSDNQLGCYIVLDIHHGLATSRDIAVEPLINTCNSINFEEFKLNIPDLSWLLLHLVYKVYWEGNYGQKNTFYQYADICRLVLCMNDKEFKSFYSLLKKYDLELAGYFVIKRLQTDFSISPSEETSYFLEKMSSVVDNNENSSHEHIIKGEDMWSKLWTNHYWRR